MSKVRVFSIPSHLRLSPFDELSLQVLVLCAAMSEPVCDMLIYPVTQTALHVSAGMKVLHVPEGPRYKATDVSPWYGVFTIIHTLKFAESSLVTG